MNSGYVVGTINYDRAKNLKYSDKGNAMLFLQVSDYVWNPETKENEYVNYKGTLFGEEAERVANQLDVATPKGDKPNLKRVIINYSGLLFKQEEYNGKAYPKLVFARVISVNVLDRNYDAEKSGEVVTTKNEEADLSEFFN